MRAAPSSVVALLLAALGCATDGSSGPTNYLRYVARDVGFEHVLMRWQTTAMPLRVHLPPPPADLTMHPEVALDAVRDGVTDWTDVAGPGVPSFRFVDEPGDADIPIVWDAEPTGWFVAQCVYQLNDRQRRFGVARILVTTRDRGDEVSPQTLYATVLHEMGHALGLIGHSPDPADVMYPDRGFAITLSQRDRETLRLLYSKPNGTPVTGARSAD
jgi:predicted Zn-dependent protease